MGIRYHVTRHAHSSWCPFPLGNSAAHEQFFNQSLLLRAKAYHGLLDPILQQKIISDDFSVEDIFALLEKSSELPSVESLTSILEECIDKKDLTNAWKLYMHILAIGLETTGIFGEPLLCMFVECGGLTAAESVFPKLALDDVHTWTYMVQMLVNNGEFQQAIDLLKKFDADFACPNKYLYQTLLKVCGSIQCIEEPRKIHCESVKKGFDRDSYFGSALLDTYAKNGLVQEMQAIFDDLSGKDVVAWTALILGYAENGFGGEALQKLSQMQYEGIFPNAVTFMCSLKACAVTGHMDKGREIHTELAKEGYDKDCHVGSTLMSMYMNSGSLIEAQKVFDELPFKDVVLWTALIGGYADNGYGEKALDCFERMKLDGVCPNVVTSVCSLKACGSSRSCGKGKWLHLEIIKKGFDRDSYVNSALVDMYIQCGSFVEAQKVFEKLSFKNLVLWNAMVAGYAEHKSVQEAWDCLERLQLEGLSPDSVTLVSTLKARVGVCKGQILHTKITEFGFEDPFVGSSLVDTYCKLGLLEEAQHVFDELSTQDVASWNALIVGYAEHGFGEEAVFSLEKLHDEGVPIDAITAVCGLKACIVLGALDKGQWIHMQAVKQALVEEDMIIGSALVDMYAKCNSLSDACVLFESVSSQGIASWGTLLMGFACQGEDKVVFSLFDEMLEYGVQPDELSYLSILAVCSHAGLIEMGVNMFIALSRDCAVPTTLEHHNCLVDLLSRAGRLDVAVATINEMPLQPNIVTWASLLGCCRKCGDIELAKQAFSCAARLKEKKGAIYISMVGIYAENSMWQDIEQLEQMMMNF